MAAFDTFSDGHNRFLEILDKVADAATVAAEAYANKAAQPNITVNVEKSADVGTNLSSEIGTHIRRLLSDAARKQDR